MKPGDHPDFFRLPAPEGRSRESSIFLDKSGRFFHDGEPIERPSMQLAFSRWIRRHPDDGRFILENGYDFTYFTVEDTPFFVTGLRWDLGPDGEPVRGEVSLSDGSREPLSAESLEVGVDGVVVCRVKGGAYQARFHPGPQATLGPALRESQDGIVLRVADRDHPIPPRGEIPRKSAPGRSDGS